MAAAASGDDVPKNLSSSEERIPTPPLTPKMETPKKVERPRDMSETTSAPAMARSQSPYITLRDHPFDDDEDQAAAESTSSRGRGRRSVSRSGSFRKRDSSWDKKWAEQVRKNSTDRTVKPEVNPGRLDNSSWEQRAVSVGKSNPPTPNFKMRIVTPSKREETPPLPLPPPRIPPDPSEVIENDADSPPPPPPPPKRSTPSPSPGRAKRKIILRAVHTPSPSSSRRTSQGEVGVVNEHPTEPEEFKDLNEEEKDWKSQVTPYLWVLALFWLMKLV